MGVEFLRQVQGMVFRLSILGERTDLSWNRFPRDFHARPVVGPESIISPHPRESSICSRSVRCTDKKAIQTSRRRLAPARIRSQFSRSLTPETLRGILGFMFIITRIQPHC